MKQSKYLKGALILLTLLLGFAGRHAWASETLADKITKYLGVAEQNILADSPFYASKNLSRRLDRAFTFNAGDRTVVDSNKLNEITRELADVYFSDGSQNLTNRTIEIYSSWSEYLAGDFSRVSVNSDAYNNVVSNMVSQSLRQLLIINELEKDGMDPLVAEIVRTAMVKNLTISLDVLGGTKWSAITLDSATKLIDTVTKKDLLDSLDRVVLTLKDIPLRNLLKGVIINLAGLNF